MSLFDVVVGAAFVVFFVAAMLYTYGLRRGAQSWEEYERRKRR